MRFLGMAGFYRKFCENFSAVAEPLTNMLSKSKEFVWTADCQGSFEGIKTMLMNDPVLRSPQFDRPFKLAVDASGTGIGAALLQEFEGVDHPIGYFSKKLNKHQKAYSTVEKEALALVMGVKHFEIYLSAGNEDVLVYTDHNPLTFLNKFKEKNQRLLRWALTLQPYRLVISHIKGTENVLADTLSRGE